MAEDTTKKGENGESEEPENKDWDWEAATPTRSIIKLNEKGRRNGERENF